MILSRVKQLVPDMEPRCLRAVFPDDGETVEELMENLKEED